jgi:dihydrolipoamide dehydrogenase
LSEQEAEDMGYTVVVGKYPMLGNSKTVLSMGERGFIKVIGDSETGHILGAQLLCDRATDMVSEFATAIVNKLTAKDLAAVIRPHPTYSEAITEAAEDVEGMAIHLIPKKR